MDNEIRDKMTKRERKYTTYARFRRKLIANRERFKEQYGEGLRRMPSFPVDLYAALQTGMVRDFFCIKKRRGGYSRGIRLK